MIQQFQTYNENIFKPKKLRGRNAVKKQMLEKRYAVMREFIQKHKEDIEKKTKSFKFSSVDSDDLEQVTCYFLHEETMLDFFEIDEDSDQEEIDTFLNLYVMGVLLKDKIKVGDFFDWKEESKCIKYVYKNLKAPWKYAYNAYPGGDGTAVVFSKIKLENCEDAVGDDEDDD